MKKINKETLKIAANKLMFEMSDEEYDILLNEFDILEHQLEAIGTIDGIDEVIPMTFPFECSTSYLRDDVPSSTLSREDALKNAKDVVDGQIRLPKVV